MLFKELVNLGRKYLEDNNIEDSSIISKILIEYLCDISREDIIYHYEDVIEIDKVNRYKELLNKVVEGIPVQYITNRQEFMGLEFYVDENVLIPQPDTEILVEEVIEKYKDRECKILDLCTGSGAIGISLAKYIEGSEVFASDISCKALQIAKLNAERNLVHRKMNFIESNMFENFAKFKAEKFDIIVSNPPYIKSDVINQLDIQVKNEPHLALDGGADGLEFYRLIADDANLYLKDNGMLFLEIGYDQRDSVIKLLKKNNCYSDIYSKKDLGGNDRIVVSTIRR